MVEWKHPIAMDNILYDFQYLTLKHTLKNSIDFILWCVATSIYHFNKTQVKMQQAQCRGRNTYMGCVSLVSVAKEPY